MNKIKIGVIFGGMSTENEVSCISGASVIKHLNKEKYNVFPIYIDKIGNWYKVKLEDVEKSEELDINFIGNVEGRDAFSGKVDAIVTDGFTGNVFLKTAEGLGKFVKRTLTESFTKNLCTKLQYLVAKKPIKSMSKAMDYKSYGGALFLGVKKPVVKAHGSSDELLFEYTIIQAEKFVQNKAVPKMIEEFEKTKAMVK